MKTRICFWFRENKMKFPLIFLAVYLIGIAVALMLESRLGCDPIGLMCDGLSRAFNIRYGTASFIYNIVIIGAAFAFAILMQLRLGMTALDAVLVKIEKATRIPYLFLKTGADLLLITGGILTGGIFGAGTVFSALVTGILIAKFKELIRLIQDRNRRETRRQILS